MLKLCIKIWAAANLMVFLVFGTFLLSHNVGASLLSLLYSSLFSLPAVLVLYGLLRFLQFAQGNPWFSWAVLLTGTALSSFVAYGIFQAVTSDPELDFILPLSFVCGYSAVLLFSPCLHNRFLTFYYERYENN